MTLDQAIELLSACTREELRDHAFGDAEIAWMRDGVQVGFAYIGGSAGANEILVTDGVKTHVFSGEDFQKLRYLGEEKIERNDTTGPATFVPGRTMPGLTLGDVLEEITKKPEDV